MEQQESIGGPQGTNEQQGTTTAWEGGEGPSSGGRRGPGTTHEDSSWFDRVKAWASDLFGQASEVIVRPGEFFDALPQEGELWRATVFALVMGAVAGILGFCLRILPPLSSVLTTALGAFAGTVVGAVLVHVLAMLAGGKGALDASYRIAAYMMAFLPLVVVAGLLPYLNIAVAGYALYALIVAAVSVHELEERRAWSVFGAVGAVVLVLALLGRFAGHSGSSVLEGMQNLGGQKQRAAGHLERQLEQLRQGQSD